MALPSPSMTFYKEYKKLILEFIWNEKEYKISSDKLIQDYEHGGLKLIDLEAKNLALKAAWVTIGKVESSPIYYDLPIKSPLIWNCTIKETDKVFRNSQSVYQCRHGSHGLHLISEFPRIMKRFWIRYCGTIILS